MTKIMAALLCLAFAGTAEAIGDCSGGDEFITIQRAAATIWDPAARWEISYGNTKFYEFYSDSDTPPLQYYHWSWY
jgi:hypothetical protein